MNRKERLDFAKDIALAVSHQWRELVIILTDEQYGVLTALAVERGLSVDHTAQDIIASALREVEREAAAEAEGKA